MSTKRRLYKHWKIHPESISAQIPEAKERTVTAENKRDLASLNVQQAKRKLQQVEIRMTEARRLKDKADEEMFIISDEVCSVLLQEDCLWNDRFHDLVKFKKQHGHCTVPCPKKLVGKGETYPKNEKQSNELQYLNRLSKWVMFQRSSFNQNKIPTHMFIALERLGFSWNVSQNKWQQNFEELVAFKKENGNFNVPTAYKKIPNLETGSENYVCNIDISV